MKATPETLADRVPPGQALALSLIKRASTLELQLEQAEGRLSKGEQIDLDCYGRAASHLRRILESLGLERKPRTITPTLEEYARRVERNGAGASV